MKSLSEDEAKQAIADFVGSKCFYSRNPIRNMQFINIESSYTIRYVLQTLTETRATGLRSEPYSEDDPLQNDGNPPFSIWDVPVLEKITFQNKVLKIEVPNTAVIKQCESCDGNGTKKCNQCNGGRRICNACNGTGNNNNQQQNPHFYPKCNHCIATGFVDCMYCCKTGRIQCKTCNGKCSLKWFTQLTVNFENYVEDFFEKSENLPDDVLRDCNGECTFSEQNYRLDPVNHSELSKEISKASFDLIQSHLSKFDTMKILQRQEVFVIPVSKCRYNRYGSVCAFYVYGLDRQVYAPDYPEKCCDCSCCCSII